MVIRVSGQREEGEAGGPSNNVGLDLGEWNACVQGF